MAGEKQYKIIVADRAKQMIGAMNFLSIVPKTYPFFYIWLLMKKLHFPSLFPH